MRKLNKRKGLLDGIVEGVFKQDLVKNKIFSILILSLGCITVDSLEGDITVFIMMYILGIALFFAKENWID